MSNTTIDQLLRFTTPTLTGRDLSRSGNASGDLFRAHLERASDSSEAKLPTVRDSDEPGRERAPVEEDDPLETQTEQQETSTSEPKEPQATTESPEKAKSTEETQEAAEAGDELTLSATAVAETDGTTVDSANSVEAESQTLTSISQNPEGGQPTANSTNANTETNTETNTEADTEANSATTATTAVDPRSLEGETGQEGPDTANRTDSDAREGSRSPKTQAANSLPNTSADPSETKDANAKSIAGPSAAGPSQGTDASEVLLETEAGEGSAKERGDGKSDGPVSALAKHDTSTTVDTELTDATKQLGASDTTPAASNAGIASRGSESVAGLEPSLGSASTGKATSPTNAANGQEPTGMPTIDRARFVQRVGGAIRTAQQRDGQIQLRLSPPELGSLRIQITINEGVVTARLEAETAAARTVLLDNLPALRERLAEQQVRIEKFDVDVRQEGQETPDNSGAQERQANRSRAQTNKTTQRVPTARSATKEADSNHSSTDSGLDVRI